MNEKLSRTEPRAADAQARRRRLRIRRGLSIPIAGAPVQTIEDARQPGAVALLGPDYPGVRTEMMVAEDDPVAIGQTLFRDRRRPDIRFTAPGSGRVKAIERGARRAVQAVVIELDGRDRTYRQFEAVENPERLSRETVQQQLQLSGLWTALRTRPFTRIPDPGSAPDAIFVTAIDTNPLCADPAVVLKGHEADFADGLRVLTRLTDGSVFVCRGPALEIELPDQAQVVDVVVEGPHPAGLPGTHIHMLRPVSDRISVWQVGYQDVVAIGRLFRRGEIWLERVISLAGPAVTRPRLLRTRLGAQTDELLAGELEPGPKRIVSGSVLSGHRAAGWGRFLGRYHLQLCALPEGQEREFLGWMAPGLSKFSAVRAFASSLLPRQQFRMSTTQNGSRRAMVPIGNFERVMPLDMLPAPLLKALLVQDTETARELGCLELDEEDLALCTFVCCSKYDYGVALRRTLDLIEAGA